MRRWEQTKPNALDEYQYEVQRSGDDDEDHDMLQPKNQICQSQGAIAFRR
jgi:hypothetical protein